MSRTLPEESDIHRLTEAASWRVRLSETGAASRLAFERWLSADPRNASAWQRVQSPWGFLGDKAATPELLAIRAAALGHASKAGRYRWMQRVGRSQSTLRAVAAAALVLTVTGLLWWGALSPDIYRTATGERRQVTLADGSRFSLDSESEVRVSYTSRSRDLRLVKGQARFAVARDIQRPFTVVAGGREVVATGTEFNVDLLEADLIVTLLEGRVVVLAEPPHAKRNASAHPDVDLTLAGSIDLEAGEQVSFVGAAPPRVRAVDVDLATAWETGRLVFDDELLATVAARVSRYSSQTVRVADQTSAALRISGVFAAGDVQGFLTTVTAYLPVRADTISANEIALRHR